MGKIGLLDALLKEEKEKPRKKKQKKKGKEDLSLTEYKQMEIFFKNAKTYYRSNSHGHDIKSLVCASR